MSTRQQVQPEFPGGLTDLERWEFECEWERIEANVWAVCKPAKPSKAFPPDDAYQPGAPLDFYHAVRSLKNILYRSSWDHFSIALNVTKKTVRAMAGDIHLYIHKNGEIWHPSRENCMKLATIARQHEWEMEEKVFIRHAGMAIVRKFSKNHA